MNPFNSFNAIMLENLFPQKIFTERRVLNVDNDKEGSFCMDFHLSIKRGNKILDLFRKTAFFSRFKHD